MKTLSSWRFTEPTQETRRWARLPGDTGWLGHRPVTQSRPHTQRTRELTCSPLRPVGTALSAQGLLSLFIFISKFLILNLKFLNGNIKALCTKPCTLAFHSSVQFSRSVVSDSLRPHELQHSRPPCPSPTPGVHPNSCASSWRCHPAISSSDLFSSALNLSQHQGFFQ